MQVEDVDKTSLALQASLQLFRVSGDFKQREAADRETTEFFRMQVASTPLLEQLPEYCQKHLQHLTQQLQPTAAASAQQQCGALRPFLGLAGLLLELGRQVLCWGLEPVGQDMLQRLLPVAQLAWVCARHISSTKLPAMGIMEQLSSVNEGIKRVLVGADKQVVIPGKFGYYSGLHLVAQSTACFMEEPTSTGQLTHCTWPT